MEKLNLPPFLPGDKVVCVSIKIEYPEHPNTETKLNDVYIVERVFIYGVTIIQYWIKLKGVGLYVPAKRFVPIQESKFRSVSFEKVMEETEQLCEN